jgi:hypothetical protein
VDLAPLHAKIGQLALENDFLESRANQVWALDTTYIRMARGVRFLKKVTPRCCVPTAEAVFCSKPKFEPYRLHAVFCDRAPPCRLALWGVLAVHDGYGH